MMTVLFRPIHDFLEQYWTVSTAFLYPPSSILGCFILQVWHNYVTKVSWYFSWNCSQKLAHQFKKIPQLDLGSTALGRQVGGANLIFFQWILGYIFKLFHVSLKITALNFLLILHLESKHGYRAHYHPCIVQSLSKWLPQFQNPNKSSL